MAHSHRVSCFTFPVQLLQSVSHATLPDHVEAGNVLENMLMSCCLVAALFSVSPQIRAVFRTAVCRFQYCDGGIDKVPRCLGGRIKLRSFWLHLRVTATVWISLVSVTQFQCAFSVLLYISVFLETVFHTLQE